MDEDAASVGTTNLDLIPKVAPCAHEGTAVYAPDGETVDCVATRAARTCPWARDFGDFVGDAADGARFRVPCYVHARLAQRALDIVGEIDGEAPPIDLHGKLTQGHADRYLSPESCRRLARWMFDRAPLLELSRHDPSIAHTYDTWRYTIRWLVWVADQGQGALASR